MLKKKPSVRKFSYELSKNAPPYMVSSSGIAQKFIKDKRNKDKIFKIFKVKKLKK